MLEFLFLLRKLFVPLTVLFVFFPINHDKAMTFELFDMLFFLYSLELMIFYHWHIIIEANERNLSIFPLLPLQFREYFFQILLFCVRREMEMRIVFWKRFTKS
jgi:hypothetical protein